MSLTMVLHFTLIIKLSHSTIKKIFASKKGTWIQSNSLYMYFPFAHVTGWVSEVVNF